MIYLDLVVFLIIVSFISIVVDRRFVRNKEKGGRSNTEQS